MRTLSALFALFFLVPLGSALGQNSNHELTMICTTPDGIMRISEQSITIADYNLILDEVEKDGVARYTDPAKSVTALLDARSDEGLYVEIVENGARMQVVAARSAISYSYSPAGTAPSSPALSSGIFREVKQTHNDNK